MLRQRAIRPNCKRAILAKHQQVMAPEGTNQGGMLHKAPLIKQHAPSYATHTSCITAHVPTMGSLHRCTRKPHELHGSPANCGPTHIRTSAISTPPANFSHTRAPSPSITHTLHETCGQHMCASPIGVPSKPFKGQGCGSKNPAELGYQQWHGKTQCTLST